jgi:ATP/maltotriose-dependent transcriptional regulator MalT
MDNPHAHAFLAFVEGHVNYLKGRWPQCSLACESAEQLLVESCRNVTWEVNANRYFWANSLVYQGRWRELSVRLDEWIEDAEERNDFYAWSGLTLVRSASVTRTTAGSTAARQEVASALERWGSERFGVQNFLATMSLVQLDLDDGDPEAALARLDELWRLFSRSLLTRVHVCRVAAYELDGYVAVAAVASKPERNMRLLPRALRNAKKLRREGKPWSSAYATYIEAAASFLKGDEERATRGLTNAADALESSHMHLFAAAARLRLGALISGSRGEELVAEAHAAFRRQGILQPARLLTRMAPGFGAKG